jgi:hypothetical protein
VTEDDWLKSTDPGPMLDYLGTKADPNLLRLFVCACVRRVWHLLDDERSKRAVEVAEAFADCRVLDGELRAAYAAAAAGSAYTGAARAAARSVAAAAADVWVYAAGARAAGARVAAQVAARAEARSAADATVAKVRAAQANLVRCLFNPFKPVRPIEPAILRWDGGSVVKIADTICQQRRLCDMPVLADALEEAGCTDRIILDHCRGPHARRCFVLDLILRPSA